MNDLVKKSFSGPLKILRFWGLYPPKNQKTLYKIYSKIPYIGLIIPLPILTTTFLVLQENIDLLQIADNAFLIPQLLCIIFKFFPLITRSGDVRNCFYWIECEVFTQNVEAKHMKLMKECVLICNRMFKIYFSFCITSLIFWAIRHLFSEERRLPLDCWLPFSIESNVNYFFGYLFVFLGIFVN